MGRLKCLAAAVSAALCIGNAQAISVIPETDADVLWSAVAGGIAGISVNSTSLSGHTSGTALSSGTYTNASATYGIGAGIVLSSGDVSDYNDGPNTSEDNTTDYGTPATAAQETVLDTITGGSFDHNDVTEFEVNFDVDATVDTIFFNLVWGSEEYPEYIGSTFIDAFGIFLNGVNETIVDGDPINVNHPSMQGLTGTELDGVLAPNDDSLLTFALDVTPGSTDNVLNFIIADSGDDLLDSTVYIASIGSVLPDPDPDPDPDPNPMPLPATLLLFGTGLIGFGYQRRRKD